MSDHAEKVEDVLRELSELGAKQQQAHAKLRKHLASMLEERRPPDVACGSNEWTAALLDAAVRDLRAAQSLAADPEHTATVAMLLQMVFEKLAKAHLARTEWHGFLAHRRSHAAAFRFTQILKRQWRRLPGLDPWTNHTPRDLLNWVVRLTKAHPALAKHGPHLEYPWEEGDRVCSPSQDLALVNELRDVRNPIGPRLLHLASHMIEHFERIFPAKKSS